MPPNNNRIQIYQRLARLETSLADLKGTVSDIKDNHLKGIEKRLASIEETLNKRPTWFITFIVSFLLLLLGTLLGILFK